ncbi:MAG: polysaccharide deacetylase family protein [Bacilli bacterium]|nr:polysaccharide deacetylase family protein [Bacilli bacterium]
MFKKLFIIYFILFICCTGCNNKKFNENINTVIEENKNIIVGINYPTTGYKKIDNLISNDIEVIYNDFKDEYESFSNLTDKSELNIDYTYNILNDTYITIILNIYINSSKLSDKINYIKTYNYDINKKSMISLSDILSEDKFKTVNSLTKSYIIKHYKNFIDINTLNNIQNQYDNFSFDEEYLYIYFNPNSNYNDIMEVMIPLKNLNIKLSKKKNLNKASIPANKIVDVNKKVVALTFDDGPSKYTDDLINILKENDVVGTFFILGNKVEIYSDTLIKVINNGNEIGNHSYNHKWLTKVDNNELQDQINKTQNIIFKNLNYMPTNFRPTYGSINNNMRNNISLNIVLWNVDTMDWKYKSVDKIVSRATKNTKDLDIILMHDTKKRTVDAVKKIIPILKEKGFEFVTVSELQEIKKLRKINE